VLHDPIRTPRLLLRSWREQDAAQLKDAIDTSLPELQEWMAWAIGEPSPLSLIEERLRKLRARFVSGEDWTYAVFDPQETRVLGGAGLHPRIGPAGLELGYWIRTDATGAGYATEIAAVLTREAFANPSIEHVEIRCDPRNLRSASIPAHLGFILTATLRGNTKTPQGEPRDTLVFSLTREQFNEGIPNLLREFT